MKALIEITLCLLLLFALYKLILDKIAMHRFKRFYLLGALALSLAVPFVNFQMNTGELKLPTSETIFMETESSIDPVEFYDFQVIKESPAPIQEDDSVNIEAPKSTDPTWLIVYILIASVLAIRYLINIIRILNSTRRNSIQLEGAKLILVESKVVPYNFLQFIFMNRSDYEDEQIRHNLLKHELGHARQMHSLDVLFIELLKVIFWFHPLFYMYGKAIRTNHEHLADWAVLRDSGNIGDYQKLLLKFINQNNIGLPLTSPSNYALTKKRFKMMKQRISKTSMVVRISLLAPVLLAIGFFFSIDTKAKDLIESIDSAQSTLEHQNAEYKPSIVPMDTTNNFYVFSPHSIDTDTDSDEFIKSPGIRFQASARTKVLATAKGTVTRIGNEAHARGHFLFIDHDGKFETRYFSLSEISVEVGQSVKKGEVIALIGKTKHSRRNQLFYEVLKDNAYDNPFKYMKVSPSHIPLIRYLTIVDEKAQKKYGLKIDHHKVNFMYGQRFAAIIYDDERVLFFERYQDEPVIKQVKNIPDEQMKIIRSLTLPPPPSPAKRAPIQAIVDNWHDPKQFGVWIDGKKADNEVLKNYTAKDFAYHFVSKLYPNAKNYGNHDYQLNLTTHEMFEVRKKREKEAYNKWFEKTEALLAKLNID